MNYRKCSTSIRLKSRLNLFLLVELLEIVKAFRFNHDNSNSKIHESDMFGIFIEMGLGNPVSSNYAKYQARVIRFFVQKILTMINILKTI